MPFSLIRENLLQMFVFETLQLGCCGWPRPIQLLQKLSFKFNNTYLAFLILNLIIFPYVVFVCGLEFISLIQRPAS